MNGRPLDQLPAIIADVRARPRPLPAPLAFGMSAFVIARKTRAEAEKEFNRLLELSRADNLSELFGKADPQAAMFKLNTDLPVVGTNGGTASGLVEAMTKWRKAGAISARRHRHLHAPVPADRVGAGSLCRRSGPAARKNRRPDSSDRLLPGEASPARPSERNGVQQPVALQHGQ